MVKCFQMCGVLPWTKPCLCCILSIVRLCVCISNIMPEELRLIFILGISLRRESKRVPSSALIHFRSLWRFLLDCKKVKKKHFKRYNRTIISPDIVYFCSCTQFALVGTKGAFFQCLFHYVFSLRNNYCKIDVTKLFYHENVSVYRFVKMTSWT